VGLVRRALPDDDVDRVAQRLVVVRDEVLDVAMMCWLRMPRISAAAAWRGSQPM
jgi:hypothetical protein